MAKPFLPHHVGSLPGTVPYGDILNTAKESGNEVQEKLVEEYMYQAGSITLLWLFTCLIQ